MALPTVEKSVEFNIVVFLQIVLLVFGRLLRRVVLRRIRRWLPYSSTAAPPHKGTPAWVVFCEIADEQHR
jgi:hypothetical protein